MKTDTTIPAMKARKLPSGLRGFTDPKTGQWVCTGAQMGRSNWVPDDKDTIGRMRLVKLRWVSGDYDQGGAYWGNSGGTSIYWAYGETETEQAECFVRADSRSNAREMVRQTFPKAKFYR